MHDVYRVTTCRPGREHIVAAARLQLVTAVKLASISEVDTFDADGGNAKSDTSSGRIICP